MDGQHGAAAKRCPLCSVAPRATRSASPLTGILAHRRWYRSSTRWADPRSRVTTSSGCTAGPNNFASMKSTPLKTEFRKSQTMLSGTRPSCGGSGPVGLMPPRKLGAILSQRAANETNVSSTCHGTLRSIGFVGIGKTGSLFMQTALELFAHEQLLPATHRAPHPCAVGAMMG